MRCLLKAVATFSFLGMMFAGGDGRIAVAAGTAEQGGKLYQARCAACHGLDGKAATPTAQALTPKPRDHTDGAYMNQLTHEHLVKVIKNGGTAVGRSPMMPANPDLNDQQIEDIVAFVRSLAGPPYSVK